MYSIGEFSRISGLSIKALRLYHERELLVPHKVDEASGYRYYDGANIERARIIQHLKGMEFSLTDIVEILEGASDDADAIKFLKDKRAEIVSKISNQKKIVADLDMIISKEEEAIMALNDAGFEIEERMLDTLLVAGIRFKGKYSDCGEMFGKLGKAVGRYINGKPINLYYDSEFKEDGADIETCFPVRKGANSDGITVHELPGGPSVTLMHKGPYETLNRSYERIMAYIKEKGYEVTLPSREVYIKGPGMIFKGKPENYLTEIQMLIER
ncbi:MAG TPA: MerR family transcriptional regulator [Candidatus Aquicultor sp.]|jgi:DNA-binding transcriptional MerR regulator/effector-binding domain-containing protein